VLKTSEEFNTSKVALLSQEGLQGLLNGLSEGELSQGADDSPKSSK
jgi:hypothetical protein